MKEKRFYLIYRITNNLNQKFYIGKHETDNLNDNYFGSGKLLNRAKEKYGLENFTKTVLFYCSNREEMNLLEHYVVTPEFCQREDVYNINEGGDGGWHHINNDLHLNGNKMFVKNMTKKDFKARSRKAHKSFKKRRENFTQQEEQAYKKMKHDIAMRGFSQSFKGKHHSEETKRKIGLKSSLREAGSGNSMYGMKWIFNDALQLSFPVQEVLFWDYIGEGWRKGRCIKYIQNTKRF